MIDRRRRAGLSLVAIAGILSVVITWLLIDTISGFVAAVQAPAGVIHVDSGAAAMAALLPSLIALTVWAGVATVKEEQASGKSAKWLVIMMLVTLCVAPIGAVAFWSFAQAMLARHGYERCPQEGRPSRLPSATFAHDPALCPKPWSARRAADQIT